MYSPLCRYKANRIYSCVPTVDPAAVEPVTLVQIKAWLTVTASDDDTLLTLLGKQCRDGVEQYIKQSIVEKDYVMTADLYTEMQLPFGPVTDVGTVMLMNGSIYEAYTDFTEDLDAGTFYPGSSGRFKIAYTAGPIDMVSNASLQADILRIIAYCYENRGDQALSTLQNGIGRPAGLDQALELFASKHVTIWT